MSATGLSCLMCRCVLEFQCSRGKQAGQWLWSFDMEQQCLAVQDLSPSNISREESRMVGPPQCADMSSPTAQTHLRVYKLLMAGSPQTLFVRMVKADVSGWKLLTLFPFCQLDDDRGGASSCSKTLSSRRRSHLKSCYISSVRTS